MTLFSTLSTRKKVTRVCTSYKQWNYIRCWIYEDDLFNDFTDWILLNDCPTDPMPEDLKEVAVAKGIRIHEFKFNVGRSQARNFGLELANTEWIEILDGDDYPYPIKEEVLGVDPKIDFLSFEVDHHEIQTTGNWLHKISNPEENFYVFLFPEYTPVDARPAALLWRTERLAQLKGFDGRYEPTEDVHLLWKAKLLGYQTLFMPQVKQSYLVKNQQEAKALPPPAAIRNTISLWQWIRKTCSPNLYSQVDFLIQMYHYKSIWELRITTEFPLAFRLREGIKWVFLNR